MNRGEQNGKDSANQLPNGKGVIVVIESEKIIQALCYVLQKVKRADKIKLVKLLYLADKYHALRYGRTVTGDEYWAMDYGPVGSTAKDLLSLDKKMLSREYKLVSRLLKKASEHNFVVGGSCTEDDLELLSETDREAINFVTERFGRMSSRELIAYTHKYPEWAQHEELFASRTTKRQRIETEELLSFLDDDCMAVSEEHLETSRQLITGTFS
ncbi:MAG: SocA family protein [Proteobacteria bacterium]|nr:SocA family protein [Pseudomonadota bacterium]